MRDRASTVLFENRNWLNLFVLVLLTMLGSPDQSFIDFYFSVLLLLFLKFQCNLFLFERTGVKLADFPRVQTSCNITARLIISYTMSIRLTSILMKYSDHIFCLLYQHDSIAYIRQNYNEIRYQFKYIPINRKRYKLIM